MKRGVFTVLSLCIASGVLLGQRTSEAASGMDLETTVTTLGLYPCPPCGPWDSKTAAHLMRRAGFSAPTEELNQLVDMGFEAAVDTLLNYEQADDTAMEDGLKKKDYTLLRTSKNGKTILNNVAEIQRWWLYRMINSERQLLEKMTLFWHNHFATSVKTVKQVAPDGVSYMMAQNKLLRKHALGNFRTMVEEITVDPAMLVWLDNRSNVKKSPNENWARELVELFTMGEGNYTDQDVVAAARAFTGWGLENKTGQFIFRSSKHDYGQKTFLGVTGHLDGSDIIDIVFQQDVTAEFIARKAFEFFVYASPSEDIVVDLADVFRKNNYEIAPLMKAIFKHREFYSSKAYRGLIKSPAELVVGLYRELGLSNPKNLTGHMTKAGQELFAPPDVSGWTSGVGWLNTSTVMSRYNFLNSVATKRGKNSELAGYAVDFPIWLKAKGPRLPGYQVSEFDVVEIFLDSLLSGDISVDTRYVLEQYMTTSDQGKTVPWNPPNNKNFFDKKARGALYLISVVPSYQLN
ncbi:MAG: DUF1800 domain-containing protein [Acidobacteriota bacterium]|nr:DUF1800 domain-containing protein [Acidobacteriota bacterium]